MTMESRITTTLSKLEDLIFCSPFCVRSRESEIDSSISGSKPGANLAISQVFKSPSHLSASSLPTTFRSSSTPVFLLNELLPMCNLEHKYTSNASPKIVNASSRLLILEHSASTLCSTLSAFLLLVPVGSRRSESLLRLNR